MDGRTLSNRGESSQRRFILTPFGWAVSLVLLISGALFLPAAHGLPVWDDAGFMSGETVGGNSLIGCFTEPFNRSYFRPLVSLSVYADRHLVGNNTFVYHTSNILYHVATVAVVIALVAAAFGSRRLGLLAGLLFGVQPVQVSAVAWIGGRTDSLCALFVSLLALGLVKWNQTKRPLWLAAALFSFFLATLTKEQAVALFPIIPLSAFCFGEKEDRGRRAVWSGVAGLAVSTVFMALWILNYPNPMEAGGTGIVERLALFFQTLPHYAILFLAPNPSQMHQLSLANQDGLIEFWRFLGVLVAASIGFLAWRSWRTNRPMAWFLAIALLGFLPVSNIIPMPSLTVAPYRVGIAGIGVAVLAALVIRHLVRNSKWTGAAIGTAYATVCAALVFWGSGQWVSNQALFTTVAKYDPYCLIGQLNLSEDLIRREQWTDAESHCVRVLDYIFQSDSWRRLDQVPALVRSNPAIMSRVARNQGNRLDAETIIGRFVYVYGASRDRAGDRERAFQAYLAAEEVAPKFADPVTAVAWMIEPKDKKGAVARFKRALLLDKYQSGAAVYLAEQSERSGDLKTALRYYRAAVEASPWSGDYQVRAAQTLLRMGKLDDALAELDGAERKLTDRRKLRAIREKIERSKGA
jgi:tetratricopeptide (TPR) repeat protein